MGRKQLLLLAFLSIAVPSFAANLLTNGDFNTGDFTGWYSYIENPDNAWLEMETSFTFDGTPCAVMYLYDEQYPGIEMGQVIDLGEPNSMPTLTASMWVNTQWTEWGAAAVMNTALTADMIAYWPLDEGQGFA